MQEPKVDTAAAAGGGGGRGMESSQEKLNKKLDISGLDDYSSDLV